MRTIFLSLTALLLTSGVAKAERLACHFTEPFINFTYDSNSNTLVERVAGEQPRRIRDVHFQIVGPAVFRLSDANGKEVATLTLDNNGSDGMSDRIFPFSAVYTRVGGSGYALHGGCYSTLLPVKEPNL